MLLALWRKPLAAFVVCVLLTVQVFAAIDPTALRVTVDTALSSQSRYVYTSRIVLPPGLDASQFSDGQLLYIAQQAYTAMINDSTVSKRRKPGAMTVLAKGDSVYMISSLRGGGFLYEPNTAVEVVRLALMRCETVNRGQHKTGAACGEPLSAQAFFNDHPTLGQADLAQARVRCPFFFHSKTSPPTDPGLSFAGRHLGQNNRRYGYPDTMRGQ